MTSPSDYNVLVDFHCSSRGLDDIENQFQHAVHIEEIGKNQFQVGLAVQAPNHGEAYRRAVNAVEASLAMLGVTGPAILAGHTYGPDEEQVFD